VPPLGLDDKEHVVSVGAYGAIAMWHAHGARYGRADDAHAKAAAVDQGQVVVLRSDRPLLDVRALSGQLVASWPVAPAASAR
jgi:ribose 1,5-bisphosphokinase PhnN